MLLISDLSLDKEIYIKDVDYIINASFSVTYDHHEQLMSEICIDNCKQSQTFYCADSSIQNFSINIPKTLSEAAHHISIEVYDSETISNELETEFYYKYKLLRNALSEIYFEIPNKLGAYDFTNHAEDQRMNFDFKISGFNEVSDIILYYEYDNHEYGTFHYAYNQSPPEYSVNLDVPWPHDLSERLHYVRLSATVNGQQTNTENIVFLFHHNNPVLEIIEPKNVQSYTKNKEPKSIFIKFNYSDRDGNENLQLYYGIDGPCRSSAYTEQTFTAEIFNESYVSNISINIDQNLYEGEHFIRLCLIDKDDKDSEFQDLHFIFKHNAPVFEITNKQDSYEFTKNHDPKQFNFICSVSDLDGNSYINIKYKFDANTRENIVSSPIELTDSQNQKDDVRFNIDVPQNLNEGKHIISLWANDGSYSSNTTDIEFMFFMNNPELNVMQPHAKPIFIKNSKRKTLEVNFEYYDRDGNEMLTLYYCISDSCTKYEKEFHALEYDKNYNAQANITILQNLTNGDHNITLYMKDSNNLVSQLRNVTFFFVDNIPTMIKFKTADNPFITLILIILLSKIS